MKNLLIVSLLVVLAACSSEKENMAPAINDNDSVSLMTSYGVNTLISDSGIIKYRIVAESWDINQAKQLSRWTFINGLFMEQFDQGYSLRAYIQSDTAWYYDKIKLWELRGRVRLRNINGMVFNSEELFWDGIKHELYSNKPSVLVTPERTLKGTYFRSDEKMNHYIISNSSGSFVRSDMESSETVTHDTLNVTDTVAKQNDRRMIARKKLTNNVTKKIEL